MSVNMGLSVRSLFYLLQNKTIFKIKGQVLYGVLTNLIWSRNKPHMDS
jgi:hypothetical protein